MEKKEPVYAGLAKKFKCGKGFSLVELIVAIAIMMILVAALIPNLVKYMKNANEISAKNTAATVYRAAQTYVVSMTAEGANFPGNSQLDPRVLWSEDVDLMDPLKGSYTIEIGLGEKGDVVKYVYYKTENGTEADFPQGYSPYIDIE